MFYITYYAKKHKKFITRKGQYDKPDGTKGKSFVSKNGTPFLDTKDFPFVPSGLSY